jgi:hypothetical protein
VARYTSSRRYLLLTLAAFAGVLVSGWSALHWPPAWIMAGLLGLGTAVLAALAFRPAIEIHETHLAVGGKAIQWCDIRRIDQTGWNVPLVVFVTLADQHRLVLVHAGDLTSSTGLLRHLRRYSSEALLDGIPYRQFWGETPAAQKQLPPPRYPLLRPEDEAEVERLFQRLKSVGRLDPRGPGEA